MVRLESRERLVLRQAAESRTLDRLVRTPSPTRKHGHAPAIELLIAVVVVLVLLLRELSLRLDVDPPPGQPRGKAGVLTVPPDRQRELVVRNYHRSLHLLIVDQDLPDPGRRKGLGHEPGRLLVVGNDVDLFATQLGDDHPDAGASRPDAGTDRIDSIGVRDDCDLRTVTRFAGDPDDLDVTVGDLGHLDLEQSLDQLGAAPGNDDSRSLHRVGDVGDHGLDPHPVVVPLGVDLL